MVENNNRQQQHIEMGGKKMENQTNVKSPFSNRMGLAPVGAIFNVTTTQLSDYVESFFADKGINFIQIRAKLEKGGRSITFYAIMPKKSDLIRRDDTMQRIFGDKSEYTNLSMNQKLYEVIKHFIDDEHRWLQSPAKSDYCFVQLDYRKIFQVAFDVNIDTQEMTLIDIKTLGKKNAVIKLAKVPKDAPRSIDIDELINR